MTKTEICIAKLGRCRNRIAKCHKWMMTSKEAVDDETRFEVMKRLSFAVRNLQSAIAWLELMEEARMTEPEPETKGERMHDPSGVY